MKNILLSILCACAVFSLTGCSKKGSDANKEDNALSVKTVSAEQRVFEQRISVQGTIECKVYADVASRVSGNLDEVFVDEGDAVKAGETVLFQIDPVSLGNKVKIAEQNLAVAGASLGVAEASVKAAEAEARKTALDLDRYTRLHSGGNVSDNELESRTVANSRAASALEVAKAQVELAAHKVDLEKVECEIAAKNLADSRITAPVSGVVTRRAMEPGEMASPGKLIVTIQDLSTREAVAFLPARYYPDVKPDATRFRLSMNGRDAGEYAITTKSPTIDTTLRTFEIKGKITGREDIAVPGDMADISIVFDSREGVSVPSASVLNRSGEDIVFTLKDGKAVRTVVKTGLVNDGMTEILEGVSAGDSVVVEGQTLLADGNAVVVR